MKNLNLSNLGLSEANLLQREQLKFVMGSGGYGYDGYSECTARCGDSSVTCEGTYSCVAEDEVGCNGDDGKDKKDCPVAY